MQQTTALTARVRDDPQLSERAQVSLPCHEEARAVGQPCDRPHHRQTAHHPLAPPAISCTTSCQRVSLSRLAVTMPTAISLPSGDQTGPLLTASGGFVDMTTCSRDPSAPTVSNADSFVTGLMRTNDSRRPSGAHRDVAGYVLQNLPARVPRARQCDRATRRSADRVVV